MKVALDTNIILDILDEKRNDAKATIILYEYMAEKKQIEMCMSVNSLTTIIYILRKKSLDAVNIVEQLREVFTVIPATVDDVVQAEKLVEKGVLDDFEDALLIATAVNAGCDVFVSKDKKDVLSNKDKIEQATNMTIVSVSELIDELVGDEGIEAEADIITGDLDLKKIKGFEENNQWSSDEELPLPMLEDLKNQAEQFVKNLQQIISDLENE